MKLYSWNVNGYRAGWKKGFEEWLKNTDPDVVCLQETKSWAEQLTKAQLSPNGYVTNFSQPERKGYSGVGTFCKVVPDEVLLGFGIEEFDREGRVLITRHGNFYLANIYFPNGRKDNIRLKYKMDFYDATLKFFSKMTEDGKKIVVVGDYNTAHKPIDLARPKANEKTSGFLAEEREWLDKWVDSGFVDIFRKFNQNAEQYSWWDMRTRARDRNIGWRIDYFFVSENMKDAVTDAWLDMETLGSDHCPLGIEIDVSKL